MKATTLQTKAPASSHANAQNNGAAASPPRYGIDFLDRQTEQTTYHTGLPDELKSGVEALSGLSMANVQVHYNSSKPAQLQALAYTQGSDIHVAPGQERHLAHEAWHVVQQAQGRVKPTMQMKLGVPINDDQGLEREADAMGKRVLERGRETSNPGLDAAVQHNRQPINPTTHNAPAQRVRARSLSDTLATRIGYSDRARGEVVGAVPADALRLRVYRLARDHNWNIRAADLQDRYRADVPNALELLQIIVRAAGQADTEAEQAQSFEDSVEFNTRSNDNISAILRHYQRKAANQGSAELYVANYQEQARNFNFGLNEDEAPQYRAGRAGLFGPDQLSLDIGVDIANRVLREAFAHDDQVAIFFHIAKAIQGIRESGNDSLKTASAVLQSYLKPKLIDFINRLPLAQQMDDDDIWNDHSLNDGITYSDGRALEQNDTWVRPNVRTAWNNIRNVVSPAVLNHAGRCRIRVDGALARPFYNNALIHVGWMRCSVGTVMHEFGHHLEDNTQVPRWIKIQQLLRERSRGGELARIFPITLPYVVSRDEMRYDAPMPASGVMGGYFRYNAKYYPYGSTEVIATSLEVFHDREKSYQIAIRDPELFLAVMGVLRE